MENRKNRLNEIEKKMEKVSEKIDNIEIGEKMMKEIGKLEIDEVKNGRKNNVELGMRKDIEKSNEGNLIGSVKVELIWRIINEDEKKSIGIIKKNWSGMSSKKDKEVMLGSERNSELRRREIKINNWKKIIKMIIKDNNDKYNEEDNIVK